MKIASVLFSLILVITLGAVAYFGGFNSLIQSNSSKTSLGSGGPITKPPASFALKLDSPDDNQLVFSQDLVISGSSLPNLPILISSPTKDQVITTKPDGSFSNDFTLDPGLNELKITIFDKTGEPRTQQRTIYYSKEKI